MSTNPDTHPGDTTPWYASFWEFCARYCQQRFGDRWHLSPEQSLLLHGENTAVPRLVIIHAPKGTNNTVELLFGTSLYDLKQTESPSDPHITVRDGLRLLTPAAALSRVSENFYVRYPVEAQVALGNIRDASDVLPRLLDGGRSTVAGRLAGAFRRVDRAGIGDEILGAMKAAGYDVRETDPFNPKQIFNGAISAVAPIAGRMKAMWEMFRSPVIGLFPRAPGLPSDTNAYLRAVDDIYTSDAYHSLSIEGYHVSPDLIERVRSGHWDPDYHDDDRQGRDALAARGYWQAFQLVKESIARIIVGEDNSALIRQAHSEWYRELFQPCVVAGLIPASALAGYRSDAVFLRNSRHVPPRSEAVRDAMPALFDLLENEGEASVRAVLGHWLFGYIHPYPDGNGRIARLLMNAMLASGGYPWTIIRHEDRDAYMAALEAASVNMNVEPFVRFVADQVQWSMEQAPIAQRS